MRRKKKRRNKNISRRKSENVSRKKNGHISKGIDEYIELIEYEITDEPLENEWTKRLPPKVRARIEELYDMTASDPEQAIAELSVLVKTYPDVPTFYNYLSVAYSRIRDVENRDAVVLECYKRFPDYLFGRLAYAQICLEKGEANKIPEIFDNKLGLKLLYPHRSKFHISEYIGFAGIMSLYYVKIGEREAAKLYYKTLKKIAPGHEVTKRVKRALYPSLITRLLTWLYTKTQQDHPEELGS